MHQWCIAWHVRHVSGINLDTCGLSVRGLRCTAPRNLRAWGATPGRWVRASLRPERLGARVHGLLVSPVAGRAAGGAGAGSLPFLA